MQPAVFRVLILDRDARFGPDLARALHEYDSSCEAFAVHSQAEVQQVVCEAPYPFDVFLIDEWAVAYRDKADMSWLPEDTSPDTITVLMLREQRPHDHELASRPYPNVLRPDNTSPSAAAYILNVLTKLHSIEREQNWLRIFNDLAEEAFYTRSVTEVQDIIMSGGRKIGFKRVRLWMLNEDETMLIGARQHGNDGLDHFIGTRCPLVSAHYASRILASRDPLVFENQQYGESFLAQQFGHQGYRPPAGTWYGLALRSRDACRGMLTMDTLSSRQPVPSELLPRLRLFGNQMAAALERAHLYEEEQRQRKARDQLIEANYTVMAQVYVKPLRDILAQICQAAQLVMEADCVLIYPLTPGASLDSLTYDIDNAGYVGLRHPFKPRAHPGKVTYDVLNSREALIVPNITKTDWFQENHAHSFIAVENIQAFIATPIYETSTQQLSGIIYINFRTTRQFSAHDRHQAESFARMAAIAILTSRAGQSMQQRLKQAEQSITVRQRELDELHNVLLKALEANTSEEGVAQALLNATQNLIDQPDAHVVLLLREWEERATLDQEPVRVRQKYVPRADGGLERKVEYNLYRGITGLALSTGQSQLADDVQDHRWSNLFAPGELSDTRSELDVPIKLGTQVLGVVNVESSRVNAFSRTHQYMLERLTAAAALAFDNVWRQERLRNVLLAARAVTTPYGLDETLEAVLQATTRAVPGVSAITIWYTTPEGQSLQAGSVFGVQRQELLQFEISDQDSTVWVVMRASEPIWAEDVAREPRLAGRFTEAENICSVAAFPLRGGDTHDTPIGAMFFNYRIQHEFTEEEKVLLPIIAAVTAATIRDAMHLTEMQVAMDIIDAVGISLDLEETLGKIVSTLKRRFSSSYIGIYIYNYEEQLLVLAPASRLAYWPDYDEQINTLAITSEHEQQTRSIVGRLAQYTLEKAEAQIELIHNVRTESDYIPAHPSAHSLLCLTMMQDGELLGALVLEHPEPSAFRDADITLIRKAGSQIGLAIERSRRSELLRFSTTIATSTTWAAEIAHDVNSEVGSIRNLVYWLKSESDLSAEGRQYVEQIDKSASRLATAAKLVRGVTNDRLRLDRWIDPAVRGIVKRRTERTRLHFDLNCPEIEVQASDVLLQRVLRHLVRNALDAMNDNGDLLIITRLREPDFVEVCIADSGAGIDEEARAKLFKVPVSTKADDSAAERGQGLLFVRWMVELMGGRIYLASPPTSNYRTAFGFTLPITRPADRHHQFPE